MGCCSLLFWIDLLRRKLMNPSISSQYLRASAVNYAKNYALKPNPSYIYFSLDNTGGDCANFLSQCLRAGGAEFTNIWWYNYTSNSSNDACSHTWAVAHMLYWYLRKNRASNLTGPKGLEVSNPDFLELGDLMFYEDYNGTLFHSAIVTYKSSSQILISQHSFEALNIPYLKSWPAKKIHFLKISF